MNYHNLGQCGLKVSELCLGTMAFPIRLMRPKSKRIVDLAFDGGCQFLSDTADGYTSGASETILGKALKGRRRQAVVATKFFNPMGQVQRLRDVARPRHQCTRGQPPRGLPDGLRGHLLHPPRGHRDTARRDAACYGRHGPPGQSTLHRVQQLPKPGGSAKHCGSARSTSWRSSCATNRSTAWSCATSSKNSSRCA